MAPCAKVAFLPRHRVTPKKAITCARVQGWEWWVHAYGNNNHLPLVPLVYLCQVSYITAFARQIIWQLSFRVRRSFLYRCRLLHCKVYVLYNRKKNRGILVVGGGGGGCVFPQPTLTPPPLLFPQTLLSSFPPKTSTGKSLSYTSPPLPHPHCTC